MTDTRDIQTQLFAWQDFIKHPCWLEIVVGLEQDKQTADDALHATDSRLMVEIAVAQTQYNAASHYIDDPQTRIDALQKALARQTKGDKA